MVRKRYIKTRKKMKLTFRVDFAKQARTVELLADFNDWTPHPMKRNRQGIYQYTVEVEPGRRYQYRFLIDGQWENDWLADDYVSNPFGGENSVVIC